MKIIRFIVISFLSYLFISHLARVTPRQPSKQTASTRRTVGNRCFRVPGIWLMFVFAGLAQLVEQLICNQSVIGSSPISSSRRYPLDVSKSHDTMLYTTSGGQHAAHKDSLHAAGGGQRLLRLLTNVLEACKRTSIPVKSGRIQTRHSRKGEIAARQLVSFAAVSHTAQQQPLTRFDRESTTGLKI